MPQGLLSCWLCIITNWVDLSFFLMGGGGGGGGLHTCTSSPPTHHPNNDSSLHLSSRGRPRTPQPYLNTAMWEAVGALRSFKDYGSVQSCCDMLTSAAKKRKKNKAHSLTDLLLWFLIWVAWWGVMKDTGKEMMMQCYRYYPRYVSLITR